MTRNHRVSEINYKSDLRNNRDNILSLRGQDAMDIQQIFRYLPQAPERDYQTKGGKPGVTFKFPVKDFYVSVSVTGTSSQELPPEVATALAAWSLSVLAGNVRSK